MGTELIDHLTPEEKKLLSDLNPEIKDLKEKLVACKTDRIEVIERIILMFIICIGLSIVSILTSKFAE